MTGFAAMYERDEPELAGADVERDARHRQHDEVVQLRREKAELQRENAELRKKEDEMVNERRATLRMQCETLKMLCTVNDAVNSLSRTVSELQRPDENLPVLGNGASLFGARTLGWPQ